MKKFVVLFAIFFSQLVAVESVFASGCIPLNAPTVADDGNTVTMTSIQVVEKSGSNQLTITYVLLNATPDKKIDEGSFKIFFTNGESIPQYGGFGSLFPTDTKTRSHTWEYLKAQVPQVIEYNAGFFSAKPNAAKLNWVAPGGNCDLGVVVPSGSSTASNSNSSLVNQVNSERDAIRNEIQLKIKQNPKFTKNLLPFISQLSAADAPTEKDAAVKLKVVSTIRNNFQLTLKKFGINSPTSITCVRGSAQKIITSINPKCPSGFKPASK